MGLFSQPIFGNGGLFGGGGPAGQEDPQADARLAMMAQLLQGGGYSPQRSSFGEIMGKALMAGQAARQQSIQSQRAREAADLEKKYREAQITHLNDPGSNLGQYQPGDYTPESWSKFVTGGQKDPSVLVRYEAPRQQTSKPFQHVTRTLPDGSTELGVMDSRTGEYSWSGMRIPPGQKARVDAAGEAEGKASGDQSAKTPAKASFETALSNMRASIGETPTGGFLGLRGAAAPAFSKTESDLFDSRVQQLSTELRTVFRIPGEGSLSDQEQQQYGLQLPKRGFNAETNAQITMDLEQRVRDRLETPVGRGAGAGGAGGGGAAPTAPRELTYDPATGTFK
jgi:hypothetical protein